MTDLTLEQKIDEIINKLINDLFKADEDIRLGIKPPSAGISLSKKYHTKAKQQLLSLLEEEKIKEIERLRDAHSINIYDDYIRDRLQALKQESKK